MKVLKETGVFTWKLIIITIHSEIAIAEILYIELKPMNLFHIS